ncbi:MAG: hypothetical protein JW985_02615 [Alphaproteobacteria bacterium]|nr:hypothetical protein [Alphaproteobacteria bacterium]
MKNLSGYFKIKLSVNSLGKGGHLFFSNQSSPRNCIWGQIWTGNYSKKRFFFRTERLPIIHSILLWYTNINKFEPGKSYVIKVFIRSYENIEKNFYPGAKFEIRIGQLYDNKYWATGEILEVLEEENNNKK